MNVLRIVLDKDVGHRDRVLETMLFHQPLADSAGDHRDALALAQRGEIDAAIDLCIGYAQLGVFARVRRMSATGRLDRNAAPGLRVGVAHEHMLRRGR